MKKLDDDTYVVYANSDFQEVLVQLRECLGKPNAPVQDHPTKFPSVVFVSHYAGYSLCRCKSLDQYIQETANLLKQLKSCLPQEQTKQQMTTFSFNRKPLLNPYMQH